ncbi:ABC transporter substrate-binding protein [Peterkaempfera sp. SMS 1(5)a]|uniref:ABC transporter substrate-binding protein n=1 Tax=Peterkaempfera podocarpi TaxID=3232308 RepID=UPI0036733A77
MSHVSSKLCRTTALAAVLVALTASGCATTSGGSADSGGNAKSFTYWSMWTRNEPQAQVLQSAIKQFTTDTGVKVDVQWQGRKVLDKVGPAMLSGDAPDLVDQGWDQLMPTLGANGQLQDLSPVLTMDAGDGKTVKDVVPGKLLSLLPSAKGVRTWLIPYETTTVSLFYNGKNPLVTQPPKTFDDLVRICAAAKAQGKVCIGSDADQGWASQYWFDYLLNRNGGSVADIAGDRSGAAFKDPKVLKTAQQVESLVKAGYLGDEYDATKYPEQENNWAAGKSVFFLMGSWLPSETKQFLAPGFQVRSVDFPATDDPSRTGLDVIPFGFAVPKGADHAAAAEQFIAYFLRKDQLTGISTQAGNITPRADIQAPAELADAAQQAQQNPVRLADDNVDNDWRDKVLVPQFNKLWLGTADADAFVADGAKADADYWKAKG